MIEALSRFQNEQRSIEYVKLDAAQAGTIDPPSPETLAGYFDEHKAQFRAPEYRKIAFVVITPEEIGKWSRGFRRGRQKTVRAAPRQARNAGKARGVADRVPEHGGSRTRRGAASPPALSFDDLAKERGLKSVRRRPRHGREIRHPRSRDRGRGVFAASGEVSQPVQGKFGVALVKVGKIEPGVEPDL